MPRVKSRWVRGGEGGLSRKLAFAVQSPAQKVSREAAAVPLAPGGAKRNLGNIGLSIQPRCEGPRFRHFRPNLFAFSNSSRNPGPRRFSRR